MTTLVTGSAGFIGSNLATRLLERGDTVLGVDNFDDYYSAQRKRQNVAALLAHPRFRLFPIDVRDRWAMGQIFAEERIDKVVHLAAMVGVRASLENPALYEDVNVQGTSTLLDLAAGHNVGNFVFASSSSVYGQQASIPFSEDAAVLAPVSPYAATKLAGESSCYHSYRQYGLRCTCLRFFTVYGPRGRPDMAPYRFLESILAGRELIMFGDGSSCRDYTYVDDVVGGIIAALDANLPFEIVNLGNATPVRLGDLVALIERLTGRRAMIKQGSSQPADVSFTCADIGKAKRLLGYSPSVGIETGLARFIAWYRSEAAGRRRFRPSAGLASTGRALLARAQP